jgi:NADP-dependent aldehyde dehydrogenase
MELTGSHLIDGQWHAPGRTTFAAVNPATGQELSPGFGKATAEHIDAAAKAARETFEATRDLPPRWQAELLETIATKIMDLGDGLLERGEAETALPRARMTGERARTVGQIKMFASIAREGSWIDATIDTADPQRTPLPKPDLRRMLTPRGPVAVFGASNFPFAFGTVGGDTASALAAGCPVIVKGHPSHPGTSEMFAHAVLAAINERRLPAGLFALLQSRAIEAGGALVIHPDITAVGFTGSLRAGRALFDIAASRANPIPVYAEMGSLNPVVILPGALATRGEIIARDLSGSVLLGGGQFCTKPGLVFTVGDDAGFVSQLARNISAAAPATMLNEPLRGNFLTRLGLFENVKNVRAITRGQGSGHAAVAPSLYQTDAATWRASRTLQEEAFGPATLVIHCESVDEALACIDTLEGSLTGTLHIGDADQSAAPKVLRRLQGKVGRFIVNGYPTGVEVCNAIVHGGPYPATTDAGTTSVGSAAIRRWVRMIAFQDTPDSLLPPELQSANPLSIERVVNSVRTRDPLR